MHGSMLGPWNEDAQPAAAKMPNVRSHRRGIGSIVLLILSPISSGAFGFVPSHQTKQKTHVTHARLASHLRAATNNADATKEFISRASKSVADQTFVSFTLRGPKAPKKRKGKNSSATDYDALAAEKERLRGCVKTVHGRLIALQDKKRRNKKGKREHL